MKKSDICINEFTDKIQSGQMSRRKFNQILGAAGVSLVTAPMMSHTAAAAAAAVSYTHLRAHETLR